MRLLVGRDASGRIQVSDADTGQVLKWVEAVQLDPSGPTGELWVWLGCSTASGLVTLAPPLAPSPAPPASPGAPPAS